MNHICNYSNSLLSCWIDTTGVYSFVSVILNVTPAGLSIPATAGLAAGLPSLVAFLVSTQFSDQVKIKGTWQLFNGLSSVLQNFFKYSNGTANLASFVTSLLYNFPVILVL